MVYWLIGIGAAFLSAALAFYFKKPKTPIQPIVTPDAGQDKKDQVKKDADSARAKIFEHVSETMEKIRDRFGKKS